MVTIPGLTKHIKMNGSDIHIGHPAHKSSFRRYLYSKYVLKTQALNDKLNSRWSLTILTTTTFILTVNSLQDHTNRPIVKLDVGKIRGIVITKSGVKAEYFLGIPYAEPPVDDNRFEVSLDSMYLLACLP